MTLDRSNRNRARDVAALIAAIWFLATSWFWSYLACLFIAYPVGLASFLLWRRSGDAPPKTTLRRATPVALTLGLLSSAVAFFLFM
jgi:hypothetical protein